ncbi:hypothetical protein HDU92_006292 [Lobulomyces angularis]|nr:hypothetical protein HDU92_006292 [Lobulomyces angularis]
MSRDVFVEQVWLKGVNYFKEKKFDKAIEEFNTINQYSKILFNIGLIYQIQNEHLLATSVFDKCIAKDPFLAICLLQRALSHTKLKFYSWALQDLKSLLKLFNLNSMIDYEQLGMKFKLKKCTVLFNIAWCYDKLNKSDQSNKFFNLALDFFDEDLDKQELEFFSLTNDLIFEIIEVKLNNCNSILPIRIEDNQKFNFDPPFQKSKRFSSHPYDSKLKIKQSVENLKNLFKFQKS